MRSLLIVYLDWLIIVLETRGLFIYILLSVASQIALAHNANGNPQVGLKLSQIKLFLKFI